MTKNQKTETKTDEVLTSITIGKHTIPVVADLDELPRAARRRIRNAFKDTIQSGSFTGRTDAEVAGILAYVETYAAVNGVNLAIEAIEDDDEYETTRNDAILAGLRLFGHFSKTVARDEGKAEVEQDEQATPEPKQN